MAGESVQYTFALNSNGEPNRINYDGGEARRVVRMKIRKKDTLGSVYISSTKKRQCWTAPSLTLIILAW